MIRKMVFFAIVLMILVVSMGCSKEPNTNVNEKSSQPTTVKTSTTPVVSEKTSKTTADEYRQLEITPSGEPKCFLSPCDCNCYPIPNVPLTAKRSTCATDCKEVYGVTGCRFTNFQCYALK